ncbi:MAG: type II toxin-antitoxin system RelE/ParE family toxin [Nanoarchaeota archaeon]
MYEVIFSKKAEKFLDKLPQVDRERILLAAEKLRIRPETFITRMVGEKVYKFRVGDYRLLVDLDKGNLIVLVITIGHRRNVYKD